MAHLTLSNEVQLGAQGRLIIPAALHKALKLTESLAKASRSSPSLFGLS